MTTALRRLGSRAVTLADQVLSSVSNVLAVVLVARALSADDFGRFALGYAILTLALSISRTYFGTRVSLAGDAEQARQLTGAITGALAILSPLIVLLVLGVSILIAGAQSVGLLAIVAVATPIVLLQDTVRVGAASSGEPRAALLSDGVWVLIMAVPFALQLELTSTAAMGLWALAAVAALVVALFVYRLRPNLSDGIEALRTRDAMGESLTLGSIVTNLSTLGLLAVVARLLGPAAAGALRGASTTMGPVNVLINFTSLGLTPALVRRPRVRDLRFCLGTATTTVLLTACWGAVLLTMPRSVGVALFNQSWDGIRQVLPFTVTEYLLISLSTAALLGLKVRNESRSLRRLRVTAAAVLLLGGTAAALLFDDKRAVAAALALAALTAATMGWVALVRSSRGGDPADRTGREVSVLPV